MKNCKLIFVIAATVITGCTSEESLNKENASDPQTITLDPFVSKMQRSGDATTATLAAGIGIYAYKTGDFSGTPFLNDVEFAKSGSYWTSSPVKYWPEYALDFFGFYPSTLKPTSTNKPTAFSYTVSPMATDQHDVVTSYTGNQNRQLVQMDFHHALSKVSFIITSVANSGLNITVDSIAMVNIPMNADFVFDTTATEVPGFFTVSNQAPVSPSTGIAAIACPQPVSVTAGTANVSSPLIGSMYLIPHNLVNWSYDQTDAYPMSGTYINIAGTLSGLTDYSGNIAIPITNAAWQPGYHYVYTIVFGNTSGTTGGGGYNPNQGNNGNTKPQQILMPIQISVSVDTWTDVTEPPIDL